MLCAVSEFTVKSSGDTFGVATTDGIDFADPPQIDAKNGQQREILEPAAKATESVSTARGPVFGLSTRTFLSAAFGVFTDRFVEIAT